MTFDKVMAKMVEVREIITCIFNQAERWKREKELAEKFLDLDEHVCHKMMLS